MRPLLERFTDKYIPEPNSGCWLWTADLGTYGYGRMKDGRGPVDAHRISYRLFCGEIPKGMYVLHKCDVRSCVNPDHLFVGTHADNMRHAVAHRRWPTGERHWNFKLTEEQVRLVKTSPLSRSKIAELLNCSEGTIQNIRSGKTWAHLEHN